LYLYAVPLGATLFPYPHWKCKLFMGLYPQPNNWQCGPFALKHALIMLGKIVNEKDISRIAGAHWWGGADEIKLSRAAKA